MSAQDALLRKASRTHVRAVMMGGEWKMYDGRVLHVNEDAIAAAIRDGLNAIPQDALAERAAAADALAPYLRRFYAAWDGTPAAPPLQTQVFF